MSYAVMQVLLEQLNQSNDSDLEKISKLCNIALHTIILHLKNVSKQRINNMNGSNVAV